jgi:aminoglycoside phosphotransferase (APT) family kinase protein
MIDHIACAGTPASGPLEVRQFSHGQSNPTYLLLLPDRKLVLRKKPPGGYAYFLTRGNIFIKLKTLKKLHM